MRIFRVILIFLISLPVYGIEKEQIRIALSFDDAPKSSGYLMTGMKRTTKLINMLGKHNIRTVFFCNTAKFSYQYGKERIRKYDSAGHIIANHSHSHKHPEQLGAKNYIKDIYIAHNILKKFENFKQWYRYPYLNQGTKKSVRDSIWHALDDMNYKIGYCTVDNYEWYLNKLYGDAVKNHKNPDFETTKKMYIDHIMNSIYFYDDMAKNELGYSPPHVLLLHESDLTSVMLEPLLNAFKKHNISVIDPEKAYSDKMLSIRPETMKNFQGRIAAHAAAQGYKGMIHQKSESTKYLDSLFIEYNVIAQ